MWRVVVCDQETSKKEEAKARYRAVKNTTTVGCNGSEINKQTVYTTALQIRNSAFSAQSVVILVPCNVFVYKKPRAKNLFLPSKPFL